MTDDTQAWLLNWFRQRCPGVSITWEEHAGVNFYDKGWIDSFAAVELIEELEQTFRIRLSEEDMADPSFATLAGLAAIIAKRRR